LASTKKYRAENVGSLLQPDSLLEVRKAFTEGTATKEELQTVEDEAVLAAIRLQESVGLDVITDGEMRRSGWSLTRPFLLGSRHERAGAPTRHGRFRAGRFSGTAPSQRRRKDRPIEVHIPVRSSRSSSRTRARLPSTRSRHRATRRYWSDTLSTDAYENCEPIFKTSATGSIRSAPGWSSRVATTSSSTPELRLALRPANRAWHAEQGHDLDAEIAFDAALTRRVRSLDVTRALHVCRGNGVPDSGTPPVATRRSPSRCSRTSTSTSCSSSTTRTELETSSISLVKPGPLQCSACSRQGSTARGREADRNTTRGATKYKSLDDLALSTQCGFASAANAPMTAEEQRSKLDLVVNVAHHTWG